MCVTKSPTCNAPPLLESWVLGKISVTTTLLSRPKAVGLSCKLVLGRICTWRPRGTPLVYVRVRLVCLLVAALALVGVLLRGFELFLESEVATMFNNEALEGVRCLEDLRDVIFVLGSDYFMFWLGVSIRVAARDKRHY